MTKKYYRYNDEKGQVEWVGEGNFFEPITDELALKADKTELFSGNYNDLTNKPSLGSASARDVGTSSGNVMEVGAFGLSDGAAETRGDVDEVFGDIFSTVAAATGNKVGNRYGILLSKAGWQSNSGAQVFINYSDNNDYIGFRRYREGEWKVWREIHHTGNILKSTGNNDNFPMSQKAVTDELDLKANAQDSNLTGRTTINTTDDGINSLQVVGRGRIDKLALGTVQEAQSSIDTDEDIQIRESGSLVMGEFTIKYNSNTSSLDFNFGT